MSNVFISRKTSGFISIICVALTIVLVFQCVPDKSYAAQTPDNDTRVNALSVSKWNGTADIGWYEPGKKEFVIRSAAELAGVALLLNNKHDDSAIGALPAGKGINKIIPADDFYGKTIILNIDVDLGGVKNTAAVISNTAPYWTSPSWKGLDWIPIGRYKSDAPGTIGAKFQGTFDGGFHEVFNLFIPEYKSGDQDAIDACHALFGELGSKGKIKNLMVKSGYLHGDRYAGGIVGRNWGIVENCANYADVEANIARSGGGITGVNWGKSTVIRNCINGGNLSRNDSSHPLPGGITGGNEGLVENCYNTGKGTSFTSNTPMAGISGSRSTGKINNCYSLTGTAIGLPDVLFHDSESYILGSISNSGFRTDPEMKDPEFAILLGSAFKAVEGGYPVLVGNKYNIPAPKPPAKPKNSKIKKLTSKKNSVKLTIIPASGITKQQIRYKQKGKTKWTVKNISVKAKTYTIKKLKKNKTYQFQIRTYKNQSSNKYSNWSKTKLIKTKKK